MCYATSSLAAVTLMRKFVHSFGGDFVPECRCVTKYKSVQALRDALFEQLVEMIQ